MAEQAYSGSCPASDPEGLRFAVLVSHPAATRYPPTLTIGCPAETLGEHCPDGGRHELAAINAAQYAQFITREDDDD